MEENLCLACGEKIIGRSDKKFCDAQCRSMHHNKQNETERKLYQSINTILKKNHQLLCKFNIEGKTKVRKSRLQEHGFQFDFHTQTLPTTNDKVYYFCYNQGWLETGDDWLLLVERKN